MKEMASLLRIVADETRLRVLRLLSETPLNVTELTTILGLAQSGVSKQVGTLKKAGLVRERREGLKTFYRLSEEAEVPEEGRPLWGLLMDRVRSTEDNRHDLVRLADVLESREGDTPGLHERLLAPGESWHAWSRMIMTLLPSMERAVDLGCGGGILTAELARACDEVVGVDISGPALSAARAHAERVGLINVRFVEGDMTTLDMPDSCCDVAVLSQTLHHLPDPMVGLRVAARLLKAGGRLILMELLPHDEAWVTDKLGHLHLGFAATDLESMMEHAGFRITSLETLPPSRGERFRAVQACAVWE
ncbi:metalloregulator ArsR/SmtB family transcription factor [Desulfoluna spongiiphila]|uniref:metalloregulator ArsR/SmtB family transcription factor n=1 Tax=Desulfoluna spongiiphila TaxID=419481 RepID=UPI001252198A|nr:metalloregulator ArsR/SmtB family transcription factor [Desulfoluna spongiiphila]VVS93218.1 s-adenosyl-l-methionine-dependent methyltransferase [Desulfoluna spongiiphila]